MCARNSILPCVHNQLLINKEILQFFVLLTHVQRTGQDDKKWKWKNNWVEKERYEKNTQKTEYSYKRLIRLWYKSMYLREVCQNCFIPGLFSSMFLNILAQRKYKYWDFLFWFYAQERQSWGSSICVALHWGGHSQARSVFYFNKPKLS